MDRIRITDKNLVAQYGKEAVNVDTYLRKLEENQKVKHTEMLFEALEVNPDLTEEMIPSSSRKYFGAAKRKYIKQNVMRNNSRLK